jgi:ABC-type branched-subunit amino acid transport system ATPase component
MLTAAKLTVGFVAYFDILHDVSLEEPEGQIVEVIGQNGAGKETLLRAL